ncbi:MAG: helicase-related protein [Betaproteobacteria bacterium]
MNQVMPLHLAAGPATQRVYPVAMARKRELLAHLISSGDWRQALVFTRTKHGANRLADQLTRGGIRSAAIHGDRSKQQRARALEEFRSGTVRVLVATEIAARGLDIEAPPHVVVYDMPQAADDYVRRVGCAGAGGMALSLVAPEEQPLLATIEKQLGCQLEREVVEGFEDAGAPQQAQEHEPPMRQKRNAHHSMPPRREGGQQHRNEPARLAQRSMDYDETQPQSNEGQLFPSSASVFGEGRPAAFSGPRRARGQRGAPAATTGGGRRRTGRSI